VRTRSPFSARSRHELGANALAAALEHRRASGAPLLDLSESNPTQADLPYESQAILTAIAAASALRYDPQPLGLAQARACVAEHLAERGSPVDPADVVLTASSSESYGFLFKLLADPGDRVLVPQPSYPLFEHLARFESVDAIPYPLRYDGRWRIDLDALRAACDERTRAIVVVSPNNPTGTYLKRDEHAALLDLGLPLIADEVFSEYPLGDDSERMDCALHTERGLVFSLRGLSKLAALPQLKLGWIALAGSRELRARARERLELIADTYLSVGTPVQVGLASLLAASASTRQAILARLRDNHAWLQSRLREGSALSALHVEGGFYQPLRLPRVLPEETWALQLLERDGVYVQPGYYYDFADEPYAIVSLLTPAPIFHEGMARLIARVASHSTQL
jgi:alanine-synthesizing transaminase